MAAQLSQATICRQGWNRTAAFVSEHTRHSSICGGREGGRGREREGKRERERYNVKTELTTDIATHKNETEKKGKPCYVKCKESLDT